MQRDETVTRIYDQADFDLESNDGEQTKVEGEA
ncbi:condesin subunit E [Vibrionales bacterium SWAT-3]|nr:condesin subunit E [Vibrionales bacterium SWAT-3]